MKLTEITSVSSDFADVNTNFSREKVYSDIDSVMDIEHKEKPPDHTVQIQRPNSKRRRPMRLHADEWDLSGYGQFGGSERWLEYT